MELKQEYIYGIKFDTHAERQYRVTVLEGDHKGKSFVRSTRTERIDFYEWGESETVFLDESTGKQYDKLEDCLKEIKPSKEVN